MVDGRINSPLANHTFTRQWPNIFFQYYEKCCGPDQSRPLFSNKKVGSTGCSNELKVFQPEKECIWDAIEKKMAVHLFGSRTLPGIKARLGSEVGVPALYQYLFSFSSSSPFLVLVP